MVNKWGLPMIDAIATRYRDWKASARWPERLGLFGLYLFAFFALVGPAGANLGIALMLAGLLLDRHARQRLVLHPLLWLAACSALVTLASVATAWTDGPAGAADHAHAAIRLTKLWLFILCAWHFAASPARIGRALVLLLAGFVLTRLFHPDMLQTATADLRPGYGLPTLAHAEYCAIGVLSLLLCLPRWWSAGLAARIGGAGVLGLLVFWLIESQGRMAWLGLAALAPILLLARAWLADSAASRRPWLAGSVVVLLSLAAATQIDLVSERLAAESGDIAQIRAGEWDSIGYSSVGIRVHLFAYGMDLWLERPWLGWGPGALPALLDILPDAQLHYQDLHNLYLDLLVRVGLLGSLPFAIGLLLVLLAAARVVQQRRAPTDLALVLLGGIGLHLLLALTNMRGLNVDWRHVWMLFGGALASFALFPAPTSKGTPESPLVTELGDQVSSEEAEKPPAADRPAHPERASPDPS